MLLYEYPTCSTCKKARKWLDSHGFAYEVRNMKTNPPSKKELEEYYHKSGQPLKNFFNTSGLLYRSFNLKEKMEHMTEEEQLALLSEHGMLIRRPLLVTDGCVMVGFKQKQWETLK